MKDNQVEMVVITKDKVIKKRFQVMNKDGVISFNLENFTFAIRKEDLEEVLKSE